MSSVAPSLGSAVVSWRPAQGRPASIPVKTFASTMLGLSGVKSYRGPS
ncbi:MAG TPA: hypothetical protein QGF35_00250 [Dehalococcoidia bacterium]|nr:hypothetical protein [Dehalococcoidia bacterium]